jgi:hypothetical protein
MGKKTYLLGIVAAVTAGPVFAGTYATVSIDGSFADWAEIPVVASDPADATGVDYADIKVANDDSFIYVYMTLHSAADPFTVTSDYFVDGDGNTATGFQVFGGLIGSEILVQGADAFQEANGGFNEGTLAPGTVLQAPFAVSATEFEFSIDRNAVGVAAPFLGLSLVTGSSIEFYFWNNTGGGTDDTVQFSYTFASAPPCQAPLTTFRTIALDSDFADWTGIPAAAVDPVDGGSAVDFDVIRAANDADNLYIYFRLHSLGDPFTFTTNYFIDGDNNIGTGFGTFSVGSELLIQGASAFQEAEGGFNEGTLAAGTVLQSPFAVASTEFEMSIDRGVLGVAGAFTGQPLITSNTIRLSFQGDNGNDVVEFNYTFSDSVCPGAFAPAGVDGEGRPLGDLNYDCVVDLADFGIFQLNLTGP